MQPRATTHTTYHDEMMIVVVFTELDRYRDYEGQVADDGKDFVVEGLAIYEAVADLMLGAKQVLIGGAANHVRRNPERPPRPVLDVVRHDELDGHHGEDLQGESVSTAMSNCCCICQG